MQPLARRDLIAPEGPDGAPEQRRGGATQREKGRRAETKLGRDRQVEGEGSYVQRITILNTHYGECKW